MVMYCPDCATLLDEVAVGDPCPCCGGSRRSAIARAQTAHAVATALPPVVVTESRPDDGTELVTVSSVSFRSTSETGFERDQQRFSGRPPQNEEDVLQVCRALRTALSREGAACGRFRVLGDRLDDVDAIANCQNGRLVRVQVTRIERSVWRDLAIHGIAESDRSPEMLADDVVVAIKSKLLYPRAQRGRMILALDAMRSPGHSHAAVVQAFLAGRSAWLTDLGFEMVWLVGATASLTSRLG